MIKAYGPVLAQLVLTTDNAATFGLYLRGERGSECGVIAKKQGPHPVRGHSTLQPTAY